jgi:hypothetical protein
MVPRLLPNCLDGGGESGKSLPWRMGRDKDESKRFHQAKKWAKAFGEKCRLLCLSASTVLCSADFSCSLVGATSDTEKWM